MNNYISIFLSAEADKPAYIAASVLFPSTSTLGRR